MFEQVSQLFKPLFSPIKLGRQLRYSKRWEAVVATEGYITATKAIEQEVAVIRISHVEDDFRNASHSVRWEVYIWAHRKFVSQDYRDLCPRRLLEEVITIGDTMFGHPPH